MTRRLAQITLALLLAVPASFTLAQTLYKWIDADGSVSYHDRPPPEGSGVQVQEKRVRSNGGVGDEASDAIKNFPVVLYAVPKCATCDLARLYLQKHNVPFSERNVEKDVKLQTELKDKAGSLSVPTIMIGSKVMNGYLESLLEGELKQAGYIKQAAPDKPKSDAESASTEGYKAPTE